MKKGLKLGVFTIATALLLSACSTAQIARNTYPERAEYTFTDPEDDTKYRYLCDKKATDAATAKQAANAHQFVLKTTKEIAANAFASTFKRIGDNEKAPSFLSIMGASMKASIKMSRGAGELSKEVEKKYQCLLFDVKD